MSATESTRFFESALNGLSASVAVVDDTGEIVLTNKAYRDLSGGNGVAPAFFPEKVNYLTSCDSAQDHESEYAHDFAKGLREVLSGKRPSFELEYPCQAPDGQRWFVGRVTLLAGEGPRFAIIEHEIITDRKRLQTALGERVKELRCIADISTAILESESVGQVLQFAAESLSIAMYYPDITCARILYEGQSFQTRNFRETEWRLSADSQVLKKAVIAVEVFYLEERPARDEGPFLKEERNLINFIIDKLASYVEKSASAVALQESEQRFERLAAESNTITWEIDTTGLYTFISNVVEDVLGYRQKEIIGKLHFYDLHPEEGREAFKEQIYRIIERREASLNLDNPLVSKDGSIVWAMSSAYPILNTDGSLRGYRGTDRDITERKLAEKALRESEEMYRDLSEDMPAMVVRFLPDLTLSYVNRAYCNYFGKMPEELLGTSYLNLIPETMHEAAKAEIVALDYTRSVTTSEYQAYAPDGSIRWQRWTDRALFDDQGNIFAYQAVGEDITECKLAEDTLRRQAQRAEALLVLPRLADDYDEKNFMQRALALVEDVTGSKISFIHSINEGGEEIELVAWSRRTLEHYCTAVYDSHYPVSKAGIWADALRERKPVMYNDYSAYPHKKGLPEGHSTLQRLISVPVIENDQVVMLAGAGNKDTNYTEFDSESVQLFADAIWQIIAKARLNEAKHSADVARETTERIEMLARHVPGALYQFQLQPDGSSSFPYASNGIQDIFGILPEQIVDDAEAVFKLLHPDDLEQVKESIKESARTLSNWVYQYRVNLPDGRMIWVKSQATPRQQSDGSILWHGYMGDITENKELVDSLLRANQKLSASEAKLKASVRGVIELVSKTVEAGDPYTAGHQDSVARIATAIGEEMGLSEHIVKGTEFAAEIHDLGKISVPAEILSKPTRLQDAEFELIKMHSQTGYEILKHIEFPWPIAEMVYQHHERMDGSGYPRGLKGEEILIEARIICVADVVDAMTAHRPYRPGLGIDKALAEIENNRGILYDSAVVDACLRLFREKGFKIGEESIEESRGQTT